MGWIARVSTLYFLLGNSISPSLSNSLSSVQLLSHVRLFATPWTAACQASLSITNSQSLLKLISIESVMPSNHLLLCQPLLLLPSIFPSIRVFSDESVLHMRWPKYWSFSFRILVIVKSCDVSIVSIRCSVVSDCLQPHGLSSTRLFCPWNSPGKNIGVGSHPLP